MRVSDKVWRAASGAFVAIYLIACSPQAASSAEASGANAAAIDDQSRAHAGPARGRYSVIGVGDVMLGSDWPTPGMDPRVSPGADPAEVLGPELSRRFHGADVVFGNFEGTMHTNSDNAKSCGNPALCYTFRSPPFHAAYLRRVGFTMMSNANNHSRDFGEANRAITYRNLTGAGLVVSGADTPGTRIGIQTLPDGTRFALIAFGHNSGLMQDGDLSRLAEMVREAQRQAEVVVVSCHIGAEGERNNRVTRATEMFAGENRGDPYHFAHAAVDAGADIVFCHGPHVPRAVEVYRGRFIAYSLGNFWTYGRMNLANSAGLAPVAALEVGRDGALLSARIVSARQTRPGGPVFDPNNGAARQIGELTLRDVPESGTSVGADGTVSWRH